MDASHETPETDMPQELILDPPPNPLGGRTLVVHGSDPSAFARPSAALREAAEGDQIFIRPGVYEDKIFVAERTVLLVGAGRDHVQVFSRRGGPLYLQRVRSGLISGITFRYVGSDQHSPMNLLDSTCTITRCRTTDGVLSGIVMYGPDTRATVHHNEVCHNRESGIFVFAGAQPRLVQNRCFENHHFGIAVRDSGSQPELIRNLCHHNKLSGFLLFHHASALFVENVGRDNDHWGVVITPDCGPVPAPSDLPASNTLMPNPRGPFIVTETPLADIGR